ncbi:hypothetical protein T492DRAFT_840246 [Pavlovales sp. CCMP2436]|nr:hypothetical protein T492DRAFT_840246 [Pavlovales sp. CCMP2436]
MKCSNATDALAAACGGLRSRGARGALVEVFCALALGRPELRLEHTARVLLGLGAHATDASSLGPAASALLGLHAEKQGDDETKAERDDESKAERAPKRRARLDELDFDARATALSLAADGEFLKVAGVRQLAPLLHALCAELLGASDDLSLRHAAGGSLARLVRHAAGRAAALAAASLPGAPPANPPATEGEIPGAWRALLLRTVLKTARVALRLPMESESLRHLFLVSVLL